MNLRHLFRFFLLFLLFLTGCVSMPEEKVVREEAQTTPLACSPCPEIDETTESDRELASVVRDISRYAAMTSEARQDAQKVLTTKLNDKIAANDPDRIRLAGLLSLRGNLQSDQRALELLASVRKSKETSEDLHQFAGMLSRLLSVRVREMQKLQALNEMEKNLLQEKIGSPN